MAAVFGALIGWLKVSTRHMPAAAVLLPVAAATLVSLLAFWIKPDQTERRLDAGADPRAGHVPARAAC